MTSPKNPLFFFPRIKRVQLHAFSLYSLEPNVSLSFGDGVTCVAGANGIGKSTLLATVNYGLTGAVPNPERRFLSAAEYFEEAQSFTKKFFDGRVAEADREVAQISIDFEIGRNRYSITRGLFDPQQLHKLLVRDDGQATLGDGSQLSGLQSETLFRELVCEHIGLSSFEQFVFLQHFLLTFDESRHLLFWDENAAAQMLYLCFGGNPKDAERADHLNREMAKAGSWGRNLQFQVSNISKRIEFLEQSLQQPFTAAKELEEATAEYRALSETFSRSVAASEIADAQLNEADLRLTQATALVSTHRTAYAETFARFVAGGADPQKHPLVHAALTEQACPVCKTTGGTVSAHIKSRLDAKHCPLCDSTLTSGGRLDPAVQRTLATNDSQLAEARKKMDDARQLRDRVMRETRSASEAVSTSQAALRAFEERNQQILDEVKARAAALEGPVAQTLASLREARTQLAAQRNEAYTDRDKHKDELKALQRQLEQSYAAAEREFVPRFRKLAERFLGIDLDVTLATSQSTGMKLELEMRGDSRRQRHQLSESQRFFVDIALRMALAQHVSESRSRACLFVDTPEGSLDIAYEDRAGEMFALFVQSGHGLLMTSNINSSKLLTTLARMCGSKAMKLVQMTGWTELSDVQQNASDLFQTAYADITAALHQGPT